MKIYVKKNETYVKQYKILYDKKKRIDKHYFR